MQKFKHFNILFLTLVILLMLSGCFHTRGFYGDYHHRNYRHNSFYGPNNYHDHHDHSKYDRKYYRR
jgi:hypothetical protein